VKNTIKTLALALALGLILLLLGPFFILQEGELAVVVRFGKIIRSETEAGLKVKVPFLDSVMAFPKKIQSWDGEAQRFPTQENQFIWVDTTARWRIADLKKFYETMGSIPQAQSRLDDVIDSTVRRVIANSLLREAIRNSNVINEIARHNVFAQEDSDSDGNPVDTSIISTFTQTRYPEITQGRIKLSNLMLSEARAITPQYGIDLIDIVIRQIKYSDDLTESVYNRMIKERSQIAQAFRSDGEGQKATWLGRMDRELRTVQSEADRQAKEIRARADQEALSIRNTAYQKDPAFADFWMALDAYERVLPKLRKTFTTDLEFFQYLHRKN